MFPILVTYGMTSSNAYYYTKVMSELFLQTSSDSRVSFQSIGSMADFWVVSTHMAWHSEPRKHQLGWDIQFLLNVLLNAFSKTFYCLLTISNSLSYACKISTGLKYSIFL